MYLFYVFVVTVNGKFTFNIVKCSLIVVRKAISLWRNIFNPDVLLEFHINSDSIF